VAFDPFGNLIEILEHDKRRYFSKDYVLNLAKNLRSGAKVTLFALGALIAVSLTVSADDSQTLVTLKGKRYEKVHVTEITPATIAFTHSTGVARLSFTEFGPDVQKKYGYDEGKARAWVVEQMSQATKAEQEQHQKEVVRREQGLRNMEALEAWRASLGPGELYYDAVRKQIRNADRDAELRSELLKQMLTQRYLNGATR
jgi:hypothetical protein